MLNLIAILWLIAMIATIWGWKIKQKKFEKHIKTYLDEQEKEQERKAKEAEDWQSDNTD